MALRPARPAHGVLADVPHGLHPLRRLHPAGGRVAGHPRPLRRRHRARRPAPAPAHHRLPRPDPSAAHPAVPRPRPRRALRLAAPPRPRRRTLPRVGQARHHGPHPTRRRLGVLRLDRGPVHGVPARGLARAPRHGRPGPTRPPAPHRPGRRRGRAATDARHRSRHRHHLVRHAALRPLQLLGRPRRHGGGLARGRLHRRRPGPPRSRRLPLPDRPAPRPHHQRGRQRLSRRDRERPGRRRRRRRGGRLRPARRAVGPARLRRLRRRTPLRELVRRDEEALRAAASARLAPYKRPKTYIAATDLPHTATGKLMRRAVPEHLGLSG